jgi:hypothetical protein
MRSHCCLTIQFWDVLSGTQPSKCVSHCCLCEQLRDLVLILIIALADGAASIEI